MIKAGAGKGVIFDLDGVLIDSGAAHKQSWFDLAAKEGYKKMSDEFFHDTFGMQNYQILPILEEKELSKERIDELSDWKEQRYRDIFADTIKLADGAENLFKELKVEGFLLAIGSSTPKENLDFVMEHLKIEKYFKTIVSMKDVTRGKPAPDTFLLAAKNLNLEPNNCVVIEDSLAGLEAAIAAQMIVIALTTTRRRDELTAADMIVNGLYELGAKDFVAIFKAQAA